MSYDTWSSCLFCRTRVLVCNEESLGEMQGSRAEQDEIARLRGELERKDAMLASFRPEAMAMLYAELEKNSAELEVAALQEELAAKELQRQEIAVQRQDSLSARPTQDVQVASQRQDSLMLPWLPQMPQPEYGSNQSARTHEDALFMLSETVSDSYGQDGARLGSLLRERGWLPHLMRVLEDSTATVTMRQHTLLVLSNLCCDAFDIASSLSKRLLLAYSFDGIIFEYLHAADELTLTYACALIQNLTNDTEWSARVFSRGAQRQLAKLCESPMERVVQYAAGALKNVSMNTAAALPTAALQAVTARTTEVPAPLRPSSPPSHTCRTLPASFVPPALCPLITPSTLHPPQHTFLATPSRWPFSTSSSAAPFAS